MTTRPTRSKRHSAQQTAANRLNTGVLETGPNRNLPLDRRTMFSRNVFWGATRPRRPPAILLQREAELLPAAHIADAARAPRAG